MERPRGVRSLLSTHEERKHEKAWVRTHPWSRLSYSKSKSLLESRVLLTQRGRLPSRSRLLWLTAGWKTCERDKLDSSLTRFASLWKSPGPALLGPGCVCGIISELLLNSSVLPPSLTGHSVPLILQHFLHYSFCFLLSLFIFISWILIALLVSSNFFELE